MTGALAKIAVFNFPPDTHLHTHSVKNINRIAFRLRAIAYSAMAHPLLHRWNTE